MATIRKLRTLIESQAELILNESEIAALDALFGYGMDNFLKVFYHEMGKAYLQPHEASLRSLAETLRGCAELSRDAEECRQFLQQQNKARILELQKPRSRTA